MLIQQANLEDIPGVLALLSANHVNNVENKADGFVTTNVTAEPLATLKLAQKASRDNARTCMQWSDAPNGGFSEAKSWFAVNPNYRQINVQSQLDDGNSLLNFYRSALQFRRDNPIVIYGDYIEHYPKSKELYVYERNLAGKKLLVICSYSEKTVRFDAPDGIVLDESKQVFGNYENNFVIANGFTARPYEMRVYLF